MKKFVVFSLAVFFALTLGCEKATSNSSYLDQADCTGVDQNTNTYTNKIKGILDANCAFSGCHNASSRRAGIDLSTYANAKSAFENTNCLCSVHHGSGCTPMPEGASKMSSETIQLIDCWAKNGYAQ